MEETIESARERTVQWQDPVALAAAIRGRSGRDVFEALLRDELPQPPISDLLGLRITAVGDGEVEYTRTPDESMYNAIGVVHGGIVCALLDSVIGCSVHTTLDPGLTYTSIDLQVSYLRGVTTRSAPLVATGRVTKPGRRVAFATGEVRDALGKLVASGSGSCLVMPTPQMP